MMTPRIIILLALLLCSCATRRPATLGEKPDSGPARASNVESRREISETRAGIKSSREKATSGMGHLVKAHKLVGDMLAVE